MDERLKLSQKALESLDKSAILVSGDKPNLMTIGWGSIGIMWRKPVITIPVRFSRYSHELMEAGTECTVCFPKPGQMGKAISLCGTKSGRDVDKIKELKLTMEASKSVSVPHIADSGIVFECRILYRTDLAERGFVDREILEGVYPERNFHTLYFAEILEAYEK